MENVEYMISRKYNIDYLRNGGDEAKIDVYKDRVEGWIIEQAEFIGEKSKHSGFAELLIILSFFEGHAKYLPDSPRTGGGNRFKHVIKKVFPELEEFDLASEALRVLWKDGRCGLYHGGITGTRVTISGADHAIALSGSNDFYKVDINPGKFVQSVRDYFEVFIGELRKEENQELRDHFSNAFA